MFGSQKWQFLLLLLMLPLFVLALLRTELRWRECTADEGRVCFNYPLYLPYEVRQQIDVHWIASLPAGTLGLNCLKGLPAAGKFFLDGCDRCGPDEGLRIFVPGGEERVDTSDQIFDAVEDSTTNRLAGNLRRTTVRPD